jgi:hypothetical protein
VIGNRSFALLTVLFVAAFAPPTRVFELRDVDLSGWDCLTKLEGAARTEDGKARNRQKNRAAIDLSSVTIKSFDTAAFLAQTADYDRQLGKKHRRFLTPPEREQLAVRENQIVSLTGWLVLAYPAIPEATNCRSHDFVDWHLELSSQPADHPAQIGDPTPIICEITPRTESLVYRSGVRMQRLAAFIRSPDNTFTVTGSKPHKVRLTGYLVWDDEHNREDSDVGLFIGWFSKDGYHHPWRSSAWEIHPVMKVEDLGTL